MNVLPNKMRMQIIHMLAEGNSISAISRVTGVHRDTIARLLVWFGKYCRALLNSEMRDLTLRHVQVDELWAYVRKKEGKVTGQEDDVESIGEQWIYVAFDHDTRLIPAFHVGRHDAPNTEIFIADLSRRIKKPTPHETDRHAYVRNRIKPVVRISSDGWQSYEGVIDMHFARFADYGQVVKNYTNKFRERTDQPFIRKRVVWGEVKDKDISTSLVERNNLTIRTFVKRLNRKSICFSKKLDNLKAAMALHVAYYNYCLRHKSLGTSPAHAAGIAERRLSFIAFYQHALKRLPWGS